MTHLIDAPLRLFYEQVVIHSPEAISIAGIPIAPDSDADPTTTSVTTPALTLLQNALYRYAYIRPFTGTLPSFRTSRDPQESRAFLDELIHANAGQPHWEDGWSVAEIGSANELLATKGTRTRLVRPGEYIHLDGVGSGVQVGRPIRLFFPTDSTTLQSAFYFIFGESSDPRFDPANVVRFYWNVAPTGAATLVRLLTTRLNRFQIPFRFKCANEPNAYTMRSDSAVLYVNPRFQPITADLLAEVYEEIAPHILGDTPLFTYRIAPGLAFAEDPANGDSFGMSRCRLVAEGIWQAYQDGDQSVAGRIAAVKNVFAAYDLVWDYPYLNPDSDYPYYFPRMENTGYERAA